jgi:hypothetical protein
MFLRLSDDAFSTGLVVEWNDDHKLLSTKNVDAIPKFSRHYFTPFLAALKILSRDGVTIDGV